MRTEQIFIFLLRFAVCGGAADENFIEQIKTCKMDELYALAKKHDMAHIISKALWDLGLSDKGVIGDKFTKQQMLAIYRYENSRFEVNSICNTFEKADIRFLLLKGAVLREHYAEPWMRTSCDIDVLVRPERLDDAVECLQNELHYTLKYRTPHDILLDSPSGVHLELHFQLFDRPEIPYEQVLTDVWEHTISKTDSAYQMIMTPAMFYYFHIEHMARHFIGGGCGVKPILDLWILHHKAGYSLEDAAALLEQGGLLTFAKAARDLSEVWFSNVPADEVLLKMGSYILTGGVYGVVANRILVKRAKGTSKARYVFHRLIPSYRTMKMYYTALEKYPLLLPLYWVYHWTKGICGGKLKRVIHDVASVKTVSDTQIGTTAELLEYLEL